MSLTHLGCIRLTRNIKYHENQWQWCLAAVSNVLDNTGYEILPDTGYRISFCTGYRIPDPTGYPIPGQIPDNRYRISGTSLILARLVMCLTGLVTNEHLYVASLGQFSSGLI